MSLAAAFFSFSFVYKNSGEQIKTHAGECYSDTRILLLVSIWLFNCNCDSSWIGFDFGKGLKAFDLKYPFISHHSLLLHLADSSFWSPQLHVLVAQAYQSVS